jgi:hypothetical protein
MGFQVSNPMKNGDSFPPPVTQARSVSMFASPMRWTNFLGVSLEQMKSIREKMPSQQLESVQDFGEPFSLRGLNGYRRRRLCLQSDQRCVKSTTTHDFRTDI